MKEQLISLKTAKLALNKGFKLKDLDSIVHIYWCQNSSAQTKLHYEPICFLNGNYYNEYEYSKEEFKELFADKRKHDNSQGIS
jgi:hypothetical protein